MTAPCPGLGLAVQCHDTPPGAGDLAAGLSLPTGMVAGIATGLLHLTGPTGLAITGLGAPLAPTVVGPTIRAAATPGRGPAVARQVALIPRLTRPVPVPVPVAAVAEVVHADPATTAAAPGHDLNYQSS